MNGDGLMQRSPGSWTFRLSLPRGEDGKRRQQTVTVRGNKRDARAERARLQAELARAPARHGEAGRLTLRDYLGRWMAFQRTRIGDRTREQYESALRRHILPTLGAVPLTALRPIHLDRFYAGRLALGLSPGSVAHLHRLLAAALRQAERWELVTRSPAALVSPPRVAPKERSPLSPAETKRLLEAAALHPDYPLILLAVATGMRRGELLGLKWEDLDAETGTLRVRRSVERGRAGSGPRLKEPKTPRSRRAIRLPAPVAAALLEHRRAQDAERSLSGELWQELGLMFADPVGRVQSPRSFEARWRRFRASVGMPALRFHDLRHTHGSHLLSAGLSLAAVSARLGHANTSVTAAVYAHALPQDEERAAAAMGKMLGDGSGWK